MVADWFGAGRRVLNVLLSGIEGKVSGRYFLSGYEIRKDEVKIDLRGGRSRSNRLVIDTDEYQ